MLAVLCPESFIATERGTPDRCAPQVEDEAPGTPARLQAHLVTVSFLMRGALALNRYAADGEPMPVGLEAHEVQPGANRIAVTREPIPAHSMATGG